MGCKQSKSTSIRPVEPADQSYDTVEICDSGTQTRLKHDQQNEDDFDERGRKEKIIKNKGDVSNELSPDSDSRGLSAGSQQSEDSGLGECDQQIITELSDPNHVKQIEEDFGDDKENIDLSVNGTACQQRLSAKDRNRLAESMIMQNLREEGLITKSKTESIGGVSFEIVSSAPDEGTIRKPARLAKLEKRRKKKKVLTQEEIEQKLARADERRKLQEEERLNKIKVIDKSDHLTALESFAQHQKEKEVLVNKKMDSALDNREKRLEEIREKIRVKEKHAEEVRRRKSASVEDGGSCNSGFEPDL